MADAVRAFYAVEVGLVEGGRGEALRAEARAVVETLRERCERVRRRSERTLEARWVREENWHLTLHFLGDVAVAQVAELARQARAMLGHVAAFELRLGRAMTFPPKRPRTLALDVEPHEALSALAAAVERSVRAVPTAGRAQRGRLSFAPHLTLARIKRGHFRESDAEGVAAAGVARLQVREIALLRSELRPTGAHYTPLERIALQERETPGGQTRP